jgi:8-hydroxy-5-deazaflavin:NADPH oxidoreductase
VDLETFRPEQERLAFLVREVDRVRRELRGQQRSERHQTNLLTEETRMKIAIIGAGNVGGTLGAAWAGRGHDVVFGVRDAADPKVKELLDRAGGRSRAATVNHAAAAAEVVALTVPWSAAQDALRSAGNLGGKILLDCTNPLKPDLSGLTVGYTSSAGEQVAAWAPGARVVKIFNTTGYPNMASPEYREGRAMMLFCGDDAGAKKVAAELAAELGFETYDVGPLTEARLLEPFGLVWIHLAVQQKMGTGFAFRLMRR